MTAATLAVGLEDTGLPRRSHAPALARAGRWRARHRPAGRARRRHDQEAGRPAGPHASGASPPEKYPERRSDHLLRRAAGQPGRHAGRRRWRPCSRVFPVVSRRRQLADAAHPAAPGPDGQGPQGSGETSVGATSSRSPRSARTPAARRRCTSSRPPGCCARATSRSSRCSRTPSRCSARRPAACPSCRSGSRSWTAAVLRGAGTTSTSRSAPASGSADDRDPRT